MLVLAKVGHLAFLLLRLRRVVADWLQLYVLRNDFQKLRWLLLLDYSLVAKFRTCWLFGTFRCSLQLSFEYEGLGSRFEPSLARGLASLPDGVSGDDVDVHRDVEHGEPDHRETHGVSLFWPLH